MNATAEARPRANPGRRAPQAAQAATDATIDTRAAANFLEAPAGADAGLHSSTAKTPDVLDILDAANATFAHVRSVLLITRAAIESTEQDLRQLPGILGTCQYLRSTMERLFDAVDAHGGPLLHDLYWPVHHGGSLLAMLENAEFEAGADFSWAAEVYVGYLSAVISCVESGQEAIRAMEAA